MSNEEVYRRAFEAAMRYIQPHMRINVMQRDSISVCSEHEKHRDDHAAMRAAWLLMQEGGDE